MAHSRSCNTERHLTNRASSYRIRALVRGAYYTRQYNSIRPISSSRICCKAQRVSTHIVNGEGHFRLSLALLSQFDWIRVSTAIIMEVAYGHRILSDDDQYLQLVEGVKHIASGGGDMGSTLVDFLPIRQHNLSTWSVSY